MGLRPREFLWNAGRPGGAALDGGADVMLDIDVQGATQVRATGAESVQILVVPPSFDVLRRRLEGRPGDPESWPVRCQRQGRAGAVQGIRLCYY